jgi:hypothetical protein
MRDPWLPIVLALAAACGASSAAVDPVCGPGGKQLGQGELSDLGFKADDVLAFAAKTHTVRAKLRCEAGPCDALGSELSFQIQPGKGPACVSHDCSDRAEEIKDPKKRIQYCERSLIVPVRVAISDERGAVVEPFDTTLRARNKREAKMGVAHQLAPLALPERLRLPEATSASTAGEVTLRADDHAHGTFSVMLGREGPGGGLAMTPRADWEFLAE